MVYVKLIRNTYGGLQYLHNICLYPARRDKMAREEVCGIGGFGINYLDPEAAYHQMFLIKAFYGKECSNPLIHYIVSYDSNVKDAGQACKATKQIAAYFKDKYQVLWGVHHVPHGCSDYHAHIILNSVSFVDGLMYHSDLGEIKRFCRCVEKVTGTKVKLAAI